MSKIAISLAFCSFFIEITSIISRNPTFPSGRRATFHAILTMTTNFGNALDEVLDVKRLALSFQSTKSRAVDVDRSANVATTNKQSITKPRAVVD